ncbi:hypothetical protein [Thermomonas aquatica]|uniref:Uncharacterized protein n=1 Tax=Thermomonas aquatica TaxID=2202149 RepID=A0A5B7ZMY9_9GAMM|nr:hypothetical protein [Thermomonas aquatica]QDA56501.1 hypothetical protein FHQ07_03815 [Thermomonas aquatica]
MKIVVALLVIAAIVLVALSFQSRAAKRDLIWDIGHRKPLDPEKEYKFTFRITFQNKEQADQCASTEVTGFSSNVEATPNGERWAAIWTGTMKAEPTMFRNVLQAIRSAGQSSAAKDSEPLITASDPGSGVGILVDAAG